MKTKTLVAVAVASTFGWSASAFAGSGHEVVTPLSVNESGEVLAQDPSHIGFSGQQDDMTALGATSDYGSGEIGGSFSESHALSSDFMGSSGFPSSANETASLSMDESLAAADQGIYSDYYLVSWTPVAVETWDVYLIDADQIASNDEAFAILPTHELALIPSSSDEVVYDVVLTPISYDDMTASYSFGSAEDTGE
ncbi:MAG TPA: hypothetical protein VED01_10870 [Burkholderiales bacterium]|nr:hypothetical protein [Burkholderiales bacterium]